ncbi:MAG: HU family DNA-binding protein [Desulfoferrobacter sp.]
MAERVGRKDFVNRLAKRINTDEKRADEWLQATTDTLYEIFKEGKGVTLTGFGSFYLDRKRDGCVFKFNPAQKLRALFGWSSTYKGEL